MKTGHCAAASDILRPLKPLYMTVRDTATLAALRDPRFAPVTAAELPKLAYEISVLSPLRRVTDVEQIKVGRDGLMMKNGDHEGLLLPQVPVEQKWDRETFLESDLRQGRHGSELLEGREYRHLQVYGGGIQRENQRIGHGNRRRSRWCARTRNGGEIPTR